MSLFPNVSTVGHCARLFPSDATALSTAVETAKASALEALHKIYTAATPSWNSIVKAGDEAQAVFNVTQSVVSMVKETSPNKELRDLATEKSMELEKFSIDHFQCNRKLYEQLKGYAGSIEGGIVSLPAQRKYFLEEALNGFRRYGLDLPEETYLEVVALRKRISELGIQFRKNISDDKSSIKCTREELQGVPEDGVERLEKDADGVYIVGVDYPTYFAVMKNCSNAATRERLAFAFENRAYPGNLSILHQLIALRQSMARLIGFDSYAALDLDSTMARKVDTATDFLNALIPPLQKKWAIELEEIKKDLPAGVTLDANGALRACDVPYIMHQYKMKHLNVDENLIKEYFPMESTVQGLFDVYELFFDIKFERVQVEGGFWAPEVFAMAVTAKKTGVLLGHIILDLFPREGKFSHACCASIVPSVSDTNSPALAVVLANFPTPLGDQPALFPHDDVETFFHEFGHAIHALLGRCEMTSFASYNVKMDFVELPSQILEEWLWETSILHKITQHYKTKEKLPDALITSKIRARNFFSGRDTLRQLNFAKLSLTLYSASFASQNPDAMDSDAVLETLRKEIVPGIVPVANTHFQCNFGHLEGYGAAYYSYLWSEAFATDVFEYIREHNGLLDSTVGNRYVQCIIGRGGSVDPKELLVNFLGREPRQDAFLKKLGI